MNPSAIPAQAPGYTPYVPYNQAGNNTIADAQNAMNQPAQSSQQPTASHSGNWLTHLLPTIGSIAAPLIGGALAPETGGLSLLAELALAGGGSALGKGAEEVAQNQQFDPKALLTSAAEGAAGQGIGSGVSALGGAVVSKGVGALGDAVEGRATQAAGEAASKEASDEAARIGNEFAAVKPGQAQVGPAIDKLTNLGIEKPTAQDMVNIGSIYTGSNPETGTGVLNFYKQQALEQAGGKVNLNDVMDNLHTSLAEPNNQLQLGSEEAVSPSRGQLPKAPNNAATKIVQQVRNMLPGDVIDKSGQLTQELSPQDGFSLLKNVGAKISETSPKINVNTGQLDPTQAAENDIWKSVYSNIKSALYNRPEVDSAVSGLKVGADESNVIDDAIRSNGITDPKIAANIKADLTDTLNNSTTAQHLLDAERPMVNVSKTGETALNDMANNPQLPRNVRGAKAAAAPDVANPGGPNALFDTAAVVGAPYTHGASLLGLLPDAVKTVKSPATQDAAYRLAQSGVAKKVASVLPDVLTGAAQFITHAPDSTPSPVNLNLESNTMNPQAAQTGQDSLNSLLLRLAIAESANPTTSAAGSSTLNQVLPQINNANVANTSLTGAENAFQEAGGGQGGVLGNLAKILGHVTGNPASQYEQQRAQLINQLTPMGIPTSAVPDITGNNQSAQNQFQTLQAMINAKLNGASVLGGLPQ